MQTRQFKLRRGFDIRLQGEASARLLKVNAPSLFAVKPPDLAGIAPIPRLEVQAGDEVRAGQTLFSDPSYPGVHFTAPVSGEVAEIRRGPRRAITEIVILGDRETEYVAFEPAPVDSASEAEIRALLLRAGAWPLIIHRPYGVVPPAGSRPRDIFVSCFDTAPLAPDYALLLDGKEGAFQRGLYALGKLTDGRVFLGVGEHSPEVFREARGVEVVRFSGPHPAGNVGVQIHHVAPIRKGDVVWTVKPQDVAIIGRLCEEGRLYAERTVALTGANLRSTGYVRTHIGASVKSWLSDNAMSDGPVRVISGNVLTGRRIAPDGFVGFHDDRITVIDEGLDTEFLGWLRPSYARPSNSRTLGSYLRPGRRYRANSNMHGEERAFVMTGEYERVVPMDLLPQHLIKSILIQDFDRMEGLGIYEVLEEDLALCEFVCTSKQPVQQILRRGLDQMRLEA